MLALMPFLTGCGKRSIAKLSGPIWFKRKKRTVPTLINDFKPFLSPTISRGIPSIQNSWPWMVRFFSDYFGFTRFGKLFLIVAVF